MINKSKELSDKIALEVGISDNQGIEKYTDEDMQKALKIASVCLKAAAEKQKTLEEENQKLASVNSKLLIDKSLNDKRVLAEDVVTNMLRKGLISKKDFDIKVEEFMKLDSSAIDVFMDTVKSMPEKQASEYASDLTFLYNNNNIKDKDNRNMAESISNILGG